MRRQCKQWQILFSWAPKSLWMVTAVTKLKDTCSLEESEVKVAQSCPTVCNPMNCSLPGSSVHGILQARILECSSSLLLGIFPTQGLNPGFLHCRWILNHLSHQGSPTMTNLDSKQIKKQRHYFADKGLTSQSYGFSSSHVWMWELDHKENWVLKNWCFWTVVLEKTLESPLYCKEIQPVNCIGNQS